jgi:hypothetical protein
MHTTYLHNGFLVLAFVFFLFDGFKVKAERVAWTPLGFADSNAASTVPWVLVNGAQVRSAGPTVRWSQADDPGQPRLGQKTVAAPSSWTPWIDGTNVNQGGWFSTLIASNVGGVVVPSMPGDRNMEVTIVGDGFSTLTQGVTGNAFDNVSGANFLLLAGHVYKYHYDSARGCWRQLGTA